MAGPGTDSPFAALHRSGSYWGFICRAFGVTGPANFDPEPSAPTGSNLFRSDPIRDL